METIYQTRRKELVEHLKGQSMKHTIIFAPANVYYYTGFLSEPHERFMAVYIDLESHEEHLFVPALDKDAADLAADIASIIPISDQENPFEVVQSTIGRIEGNVGIEGKVLQYYQFTQFNHYFPNINFSDIQSIINKQRMKKSPEEIESIMTSIHLIEKVLQEGITKVKPGMTEVALTAELEYLMRQVGADGPSFSTIVLSGEKAALPHGVPGNKQIENGDMLLIDFGVIKDGYCSDITRTFAVGDVSDLHKELYTIVLESTNAGIDAVKAGIPLKDIDLAARDVIDNKGYGEYFNNRIGHGLGIEVHEEPSVHGANEDLATSGMVFTIEPGIYIPGEVGIRIEDNVYINEAGHVEVLTSFPKHLQVI